LSFRHLAIACSSALVLTGAAAWAVAQQQTGPAMPSKPAAAAASAPAAAPAVAPAAKPGAAPARPATSKPGKAADKPLWRDLTPAQRAALDPLSTEWDQMDAVRKQKWLEMANRFAGMKPEEQQRVHERMREWVRLTPAQRKLARDTYSRTKKLAPGEKTATWESYQQLPEDQKQKLAAAAAARKQGATAPTPGQRPGTSLHKGATACPAGTIKNKISATPPCVPATGTAATPAQPAPPAPAVAAPHSNTPAMPVAPASNAQ
jgi:hypothetical protein